MTDSNTLQFSIVAIPRPLRGVAAAALLAFCAGCVNTRTASNMSAGSEAHNQAAVAAALHGDETSESNGANHHPTSTPGTQFASGDSDELSIHDTPEGLVQITRPADGADFDPVISRDGKYVVFASTQHHRTSDIYIKAVGSASMTQLTQDSGNDVMPAISPDGQKIAFCSDRGGSYNLYLMSIRGGQPVQLTSGTVDLHPSFSPDGTRIVFSRQGENSGRWELWVLDLKRPSTPEFIGNGLFAQFCPQAGSGAGGTDRIAFQRARQRGDSAYSIWTIDYKPGNIGNPTQVMAASDAAAINPTWSPDGQWIAYTAVPLANITQAASTLKSAQSSQRAQSAQAFIFPRSQHRVSGQIRLVAADGSLQVNLTEGLQNACMPTWSPDGRVFFASERGGKMGIWSASPEKALAAASGSPGSPITHGAPMSHNPASPASLTEANVPAGTPEQ